MTNHKDAPEVDKTFSGQVTVKVKDSESDQDQSTYQPREDANDKLRTEDIQNTSEDRDKGKSHTLLDEEEDVLVDTLACLDISKKSGRKSLSESSLDSDGDVSGCDSDLDSDGLAGSEEQNLRTGRSSNNERLVERGVLRNASNGRRHDKPYTRPSPETPKRAACRQSDDSNSGGGWITPEDDDMLKNLIEDMPDLSSVTDSRSPICSGSSNQSPTSSGSPYRDLVSSVDPTDDTHSLVDDLLRSLDDTTHSNNVIEATKHHQITSELPLKTPNQSLFFSPNQFNNAGSFAGDVISATATSMQTSSPFQATHQPYQNNGATQTPFFRPVHSAAANQYPPNSMVLTAPQLVDIMPMSLTNPSQLGSLPVVAGEANCFGSNVSEPSIPTVVAEKMNEPEPQKKPRRKRLSRKKDSQNESRPAATCGSDQNVPDSSHSVGIQNLPADPLPSVAPADEQKLKEALEYITEQINGTSSNVLSYAQQNMAMPPSAPVRQLSFNQPQLDLVPQQHPIHNNGQAPVFINQTLPGSQMQTSQTKAFVNPGPGFPITLNQPNGTPGNPLLQQTYCSIPPFTTPTFPNGLELRQLKPNSAQYKFICAGSYGAPSQPYFAFPFQPVQPIQRPQPVILVSSPERGQTDRFTPIQPRPI